MADEDYSQYPSIDEAYGLVLPSYDWMLRRFEAVNARLQNAVALIATVPVLSISAIKALVPAAPFKCWWLIAAITVFVAAAAVGIATLYRSGLELLDPKAVHEEHLHLSPSDFKKQMLEEAGESFDSNLSVVLYRARMALGLMIALVFGLGFLAVWAWTSI